jgi:hypothetical protein
MDQYGSGDVLWKPQWDWIGDPSWRLYALQTEDQGAEKKQRRIQYADHLMQNSDTLFVLKIKDLSFKLVKLVAKDGNITPKEINGKWQIDEGEKSSGNTTFTLKQTAYSDKAISLSAYYNLLVITSTEKIGIQVNPIEYDTKVPVLLNRIIEKLTKEHENIKTTLKNIIFDNTPEWQYFAGKSGEYVTLGFNSQFNLSDDFKEQEFKFAEIAGYSDVKQYYSTLLLLDVKIALISNLIKKENNKYIWNSAQDCKQEIDDLKTYLKDNLDLDAIPGIVETENKINQYLLGYFKINFESITEKEGDESNE